MARPTIGMIASPLNFVVNTAFTLTVPITGIDLSAGDTVKVRGEIEGFTYAYDSGTLTITGLPTRILSNAPFKIIATNSDGPTEKSAAYNVVPGAPVISQVTAPTVYIGQPYKFFVPITNMPKQPTVGGLWIGLKYEKHEDDRGQTGVLISGDAGAGDFTVDAGDFIVNAPYAGGLVSATFPHAISEVPRPGLVRNLRAWTSGGNLIIDWSAPSVGAQFIDRYDTEVSSGGPPSSFRALGRIYPPNTRRTVTGLVSGTFYYIAVRAYSNTSGAGPISRTTHTL